MQFKQKTGAALLCAAGALGGLTLATGAASANETILFNCFFPPQHYVCKEMLPEMRKRIESVTQRRVRIQFAPKSLTAPGDVYDGVIRGVMDGGVQFNAFLAGRVHGVAMSLLPFVGNEESAETSVALWRTYQKFFANKNEYGDTVLVGLWATNGAEFYSMNATPIQSIADIKNRKMFSVPGPAANLLKAFGSAVVAGPAVQMLESVSKGVVDGYTGVPISSIWEFKLAPYTKSITVFERKVFQPTFSFFIAKRKWDKISQADRDAIMKALGEDFSRFAGTVADKYQQISIKHAADNKIVTVKGNPDVLKEMLAVAQPAYDAWKKKAASMGVDGDAALAFYRQVYLEEKAKSKK